MKVCCVLLESPHRGDSNKTHNIHFQYNNKKKENLSKLSQICRYGIFYQGTQELVRNSRGKRAISVRVTGDLLYFK